MVEGEKKPGRFGTFGGVFTPSILTILGVVMYMRMGWVTGQVGLGGALAIIIVAHLISLATGLSIASIATNRTVGAGGAYFMISRSLGAPVGGAIGIPLFIAQGLSVTFYIVGFTESLMPVLRTALPAGLMAWVTPLGISTLLNVLLTGLSFWSAALAIRAQFFVMGCIGLSLVAFFSGTTPDFARTIEFFPSDGTGTVGMAGVFAVFFPAVTGIMAGVSMSGDLADARKSIPRGTLLAIGVGMIVYLAFPIWLTLNVDYQTMLSDPQVVWSVASMPALIYAGVWGATISSALGSILTAPRTLQALAMDGLLPSALAVGSGPDNEPRRGIVLTFVLAQVGLLLGSLDAIAPVLTMFFLATYGMTNVACGLQRWAANPSYRPSFRVPWYVSLFGGLACFWVMSFIDLGAMMAGMAFCGVILVVVSRRDLDTTYGDARHGIWAALVRAALIRLRRETFHPQNWRPNMVILGGDPRKRAYLLQLGSAIVQDRGLVTYFHLLPGEVADLAGSRKLISDKYDALIAESFPNVFFRADIVDDVYRGTVHIAQSYGMGSFEANTVMAGWPRKAERGERYVAMCRDLVRLNKSLIVVRYDKTRDFGAGKTIHVWWGGLQGNGGLMLLLAYLLRADGHWRKSRVTVQTVVNNEAEREGTELSLQRIIEAARLDASHRVILRQGRTIPEIMAVESASADLAILGFRLPPEGRPVGAFFRRVNEMLEQLPTTMLIHGARDFESEPVLFDDDALTIPRAVQSGAFSMGAEGQAPPPVAEAARTDPSVPPPTTLPSSDLKLTSSSTSSAGFALDPDSWIPGLRRPSSTMPGWSDADADADADADSELADGSGGSDDPDV